MSTSTALSTHFGKYAILQAELPGHGLINLGVLLEDPQTNSLHLRLRRDLELLVDQEELDVFLELGSDLARKADEMGAEKLFRYLEDSLSGTIRITDRETILVEDYSRTLDRLYRQNIQTKILEFRTHLPKYSLRAAAGKFLENEEIIEEGWVEAPTDMRKLYPDMFVAQIVGNSMEPLIPGGSICIFRAGVVGSRIGRLVLAEDRKANAYSVKRYKSDKVPNEGNWKHKRIRLESINPGYPSWDLEPDEEQYRIIAEFIRVLD